MAFLDSLQPSVPRHRIEATGKRPEAELAEGCGVAMTQEQELSAVLGHVFHDPDLLEQALTHRSAMVAGQEGYERLEFLGDRVLALVVADMLLDAFPTENEGALAKRYTALVRRETLADVAREIGLGRYIHLSRGESEGGGRENEGILADVCEAVIAALYRDGGLAAARAFIERHWTTRLRKALRPPQDSKTALQEWAQARGYPLPTYRTIGRVGPDHAPIFTVSVAIPGFAPAKGEGPSKRSAEQAAAAQLLETLSRHG